MINYLKETTFTVNEVIQKAWRVTKENYLSLATLCFLIFITFSASTFMAFFMKEVHIGVKVIMLLVFVILYCILSLSIIKYIFKLLDSDTDDDVQIIETLPTRIEIIRFLIGTFYFGIGIFLVGILLFPVLYLIDLVLKMLVSNGLIDSYNEVGGYIVNAAVGIAILGILLTFIRIIFFPFFIIDKQASPFQSIKFSLAITKGNFFKILYIILGFLLIQLVVFGFFYLMVSGVSLLIALFNYEINSYVSLLATTFTSFIIVPFSIALFTVAYRRMMDEYQGDNHPQIIKNIV